MGYSKKFKTKLAVAEAMERSGREAKGAACPDCDCKLDSKGCCPDCGYGKPMSLKPKPAPSRQRFGID